MGIFNIAMDVAIDLGTANTLIYIKGRGIVLNEPSIVAVHRTTRQVIAIGLEAQQMHERTHREIETIRPLKDGVIADFEVAEQLIRRLIRKVQTNWLSSIRRMVVCVPSGITEVEKRAVRDSAEHAGARQVFLTAERIKCEVGSAVEMEEELEVSVKGRDLVSGIPKVRTISSSDVRDALQEPIAQITQAVIRCLERTPPELGSDILERGIMLTGGGALLKGLDQLIRVRADLPAYVAEDPLTAVVRGTGAVLENLDGYRKVLS